MWDAKSGPNQYCLCTQFGVNMFLDCWLIFLFVNIYFPIFKTNNYYFKYWEININKKMYYYVLVLYLMFFLYLYYFPNLYFIFIFEP